jgi:hypothetical protein
MTPQDLGWSRGCGNGIGHSSHKNHYRVDVSVNNYVEDRAGVEMKRAGGHVLGFRQPGSFDSTYRKAYTRSAEEYARALEAPVAEIPRDELKQVRLHLSACCRPHPPGKGARPVL